MTKAARTARPPLRVLVLHGPSLSRLGRREPELYGTTTLAAIDRALRAQGKRDGLTVRCRQSNHEGVLIDSLLAAADDGTGGVLLNAGALAHTSLALADAVRAVAPLPVVEVHLTNTAARDRPALVGAACRARVEGFGAASYLVALRALAEVLAGPKKGP
ncbi:MAG: type II 3-dehydroquinate dehydratase [Deltaproteobacteria bacterium]|nr:type II 3-dehydroquinate dehydratase [Deltaproteobacteria bacterium]